MYEDSRYDSPLVRLKRVSPLAWGILLLVIAFLLTRVPFRFFKLLAILPLVVGGLFLYQAIWKNKY
ncbi:MAG: hypothetical protein A3F35_03150 [Candidatus Woykebacteria bacterium RIFCSPHIGHO2_12_FULL_45_10]|uniref:Uncharacterized protein n=1 Tax=Candidatus Woykebacteria bacterium RIFCSPHIGHO2_12_FULL_45_10 TaxID=1802603 RepID=A0A1G1WPN4_9BACT|nr:MAG: hypothetical protein A3F35_03150 [Candidatus Woykebacteria bacterium RIFCSPHIGHO2_12_FULL_45_10]